MSQSLREYQREYQRAYSKTPNGRRIAKAGRDRRREAVSAYKLLNGCADCGYAEHAEALDFDHRPGEVKLFTIGNDLSIGWTRIVAEIAKCDVVCANHHRIRTAQRRAS